ncbi:MAG: aspartate dehydrogenase, partial [Acetobacteraceae bacterium]|nr:aspartate dehydrogenase [Acetobacteraceae bacterium]
MTLTVAIGGLGAVGLPLARALDAGVEGLRLILVSARDRDRASVVVQSFRNPPQLVDLPELAEADIVVEAAPAAVFEKIAIPAIAAGRILVAVSAAALLPRTHLVRRAREAGARIVVPTGGLIGLDALRALAEGPVENVTLETREPPSAFADISCLSRH